MLLLTRLSKNKVFSFFLLFVETKNVVKDVVKDVVKGIPQDKLKELTERQLVILEMIASDACQISGV